jgi:ubiquinone/menaquinone biosynthesis C-methylase UbiE
MSQPGSAVKSEHTLTPDQARAFYNRLGSLQDWQWFYEDAAVDAMVREGDFAHAHSVLEFGCGTGRLAARLLSNILPTDCRYVGIDISTTMVELARKRLAPWASRATIRLADGSCRLEEPEGSVDRIVSAYVLDLLSSEQIQLLISECHRVLAAGGLLCLVSLSHGQGALGRTVSQIWQRIHSLSPMILGGCRPIDLGEYLSASQWEIRHGELIRALGITSQVMVASPRPAASMRY